MGIREGGVPSHPHAVRPRMGEAPMRLAAGVGLTLRLAARQLLDLLFIGTARGGSLGLGSGLFACGPLYLLAFCLVFNLLGVCH